MATSNADGTRTTDVYQKIRDMIIKQVIPVGAKINQSDLAKQLTTSRTPVVYAMHKLETQGLVESVPNSGFYVRQVSVKELSELFAFREALEGIAAHDLARRISDDEVERLRQLFARFELPDVDLEAYRLADVEFHSTIIELCGNDLAKKVNDYLQILNRAYTGGLLRPPSETLPEHMDMIDALAEHDPERAQRLATEHITKPRRLLDTTISNLERVGVDPQTVPIDQVSFNRDGRRRPVGLD